jgi:hypothetical protein
VVFVAKSKGGEPARVALKRVDWHTLTAGQRFRATLLSAFGLAMRKRTYLSSDQAKTYLDSVRRAEQEIAPIRSSQRRALDFVALLPLAPVRAPGAVEESSRTRERCLGRIHAKVVEEFGLRLKYILPAIREQYIHRPTAVAREVCRHALAPLQRELKERLDELRLTGGMSEIQRELGVEQCIARCEQVSQEHIDPASRRIAMRFAQIDYSLDGVPARQLHLDPTADAVLGDMHGNCRLLLHSLVTLGFFTITDSAAWQAVTQQLKSLETDTPDRDWRAFREHLSKAIEPAPHDIQRRLTLIGDFVGDRRGNDMFMAAILAHMDASNLDFELLAGNHEGEFLSYFLKNRSKKNHENYSFNGAGVGMYGSGQCLSLERLDQLLNDDREARRPFNEMVTSGLLKHLKLASVSRDGMAFYSHAFANSALVPDLFMQAGVDQSLPVTEQIDGLNEWFRNEALKDEIAFGRVYQTAYWPGRPTPLSPLRAIMWNIGMEMREYGDDVFHPHNAGIGVPAGFKYAVHGHCGDVASRVRGLDARAKETEELLLSLKPLAENPQCLATLNGALAAINSSTDFAAIRALGPFIARGLRDNDKSADIIRMLEARSGNDSTLARALSDFWNMHCRDVDARVTLDFSCLSVEAQRTMLNAVRDWLDRKWNDADKAEQWKKHVDAHLADALEVARSTRHKLAKAIRHNLHQKPVTHGNKPISQAEMDKYAGALKQRFFSIDDSKGSKAEDVEFSRLVHIVPRHPYAAPTPARA